MSFYKPLVLITTMAALILIIMVWIGTGTVTTPQKTVLTALIVLMCVFATGTFRLLATGDIPVLTPHWGGIGRSTGGISAARSFVSLIATLVAASLLAIAVNRFEPAPTVPSVKSDIPDDSGVAVDGNRDDVP